MHELRTEKPWQHGVGPGFNSRRLHQITCIEDLRLVAKRKMPRMFYDYIDSGSWTEDNGRLTDTIAAHLQLKLESRQVVLDKVDVAERMEFLLGQLDAELDILQVEKRIRGRVKRQMEKSQREYYLNEQVKAIHKELGEEDERAELDKLEADIKAAGMSKEAEAKALSELKKLKMMPPMSAESTVVRNYIDTLLELPWKKKTRVIKDNRRSIEALKFAQV